MAASINLGKKEKRLLTLIGVVVVITVVVPTFLTDEALSYRRDKESAKNNLDKKIRELRENLDSVEERRAQIRRYITKYQSLVTRRVMDAPDTVSLVRHMREISNQRKQPATTFSFADSVELQSDKLGAVEGSSIIVSAHPMELSMQMLHDMDLFMFLESLQERVTNLSFPVSCQFTLLEPEFAIQRRENMTGTCEVVWYSVMDPDSNVDANGEIKEDEEGENSSTAQAGAQVDEGTESGLFGS